HAPTGMQQLVALLDSSELGDNGAAEVFRSAWEVRDHEGAVNNLAQRGVAFARARIEQLPQESLGVLEAVEPAILDLTPAERDKARSESLAMQQKVLEKLHAQSADDLDT